MFRFSRAGVRTVVLIGTLAAAAACSRSSSAGTVAAGSSAPASASSAASPSSSGGFQAYRDCLSQHGVTLPTRPQNQSDASSFSDSGRGGRGGGPGGGFNGQLSPPPGVDQATFDAAQQACASLRPTGGGRNAGANAAYRSCLADHGVTVPSTSSGGPPPSIDRNDPSFAAANDACKALRPNNGPSTSSSAGDSTASSSS